jgi:hypothetical protein
MLKKIARTFLITITLVLCFGPQVFAGGGRAALRSGPRSIIDPGAATLPGVRVPAGVGHGRYGQRGYVFPYHHHYYPRRHYNYYPPAIIVLSPHNYQPYHYYPPPGLAISPFYCHVHHVGFPTRIGFLDHFSGTHKVPIDAAAAICPDSNEGCIIEPY